MTNDKSVVEIVRGLRIDAIKARCEAATAGPWRAIERGNSVISHGVVTVAYDSRPQQNVCAGISPKTGNAAFIAYAREDIPYLLERIAELEAEIASREQSGIDDHNEMHHWRDRAKAAEAQLTASQQETRAAVEATNRMAEYIVTKGRVDYWLCDDIPQELHLKHQPENDGNYANAPCIKCVAEYFMGGPHEAGEEN